MVEAGEEEVAAVAEVAEAEVAGVVVEVAGVAEVEEEEEAVAEVVAGSSPRRLQIPHLQSRC